MPFTGIDIRRIKVEGLTIGKIETQIDCIKRGTMPIKLNRPCRIGDGLIVISEKEKARLVRAYDEEVKKGRVVKFVPASGAASRMFQNWYHVIETGCFRSADEESEFIADLSRYAFYQDLKTAVAGYGDDLAELMDRKKYRDVLSYILTSRGLNYGELPKALLKFHDYAEGSRTALEEHLTEAALYARDANRVCRIHLTVSEEHEALVKNFLSRILDAYGSRYGVSFDVKLSTQHSSTNTIAVDLKNRPFRDAEGALVFRPGGHGALLENLGCIDGDIIIIKNIDNIVPDRIKGASVLYKKILGGYLVRLQDEIFHNLRRLADAKMSAAALREVAAFCNRRLPVALPSGFDGLSSADKKEMLWSRLNRPLRICGMVKNEGEPGGGPFWVDEEDGSQTLQIVESFQFDQTSKRQKTVWQSSTHFNPVDLICGVKDFKGKKFDLRQYVDNRAVCISEKTEKGRTLKALELPGLWNGSMSSWNTVFVEVPIETFNPVKTVYDLLRPQHLLL
jgi:Domain of unknown function (DUF4301)